VKTKVQQRGKKTEEINMKLGTGGIQMIDFVQILPHL